MQPLIYALLQLALKIGAAILVFLVGRGPASRTRNTLRATLVKTTLAPSGMLSSNETKSRHPTLSCTAPPVMSH